MVNRIATLGRTLAVLVASMAVMPSPGSAQDGALRQQAALEERYSANEIDNLVGPVALYPDALLAQVLVASTFPEQVEDAARFVRLNGTDDIDAQPWDVSVKAVAHYLSALNVMAEKIDWTAALGRAYAGQSTEVMESVQRLRAQADAHGNLVSNEQQQIVREGEQQYVIVPTQPQVIYVPTYDPYFAFSRPLFGSGFRTPFWSFGVGYPIGSWLIYDFHWGRRSLFYHGWHPNYFHYAGGWRARSFPFIRITNVYVNPRFRDVYVNDGIWRRPINYGNVNRYASVHRDTPVGGRSRSGWDNVGDGRSRDRQPSAGSADRLERTLGARDAAGAVTRAGAVRGAMEGSNMVRTREAPSRAEVMRSPSTTQRVAPTRAPSTTQRAAPARAPSSNERVAPTRAPSTTQRAAPARAPSTNERVAPTRTPSTTQRAAPTRTPSPTQRAAPTRAPSTTQRAAPTRAPAPRERAAPARAPTPARQAAPARPASPARETAAPSRGGRVERAAGSRPG